MPSHDEIQEWIAGWPEEWELPEELVGPTENTVANLAIRMLECENLSHKARILLGRFIGEHSLLQLWILSDVKGRGARDIREVYGVDQDGIRLVYEAWKQFQAAPLDHRATLDEALETAVVTWADYRKN
ncbi:hypothetical protein FKR81_15505 [Lentzea tibetensis]|uniref:Uncharacterized protein n=1 Tax=Lentzea tibetensis TaxID=2591470 RepID=A0A563EVI7_9PSEU|nr:hypothetical protein [Lentzea tibetensis]TWP51592.1 hypothetical protein FKR81_15505 [Lentzea tibetensis]